MAIQTTTFKGARYIVKFHDPIEWSAEESYEAIESVKHNGFTYLSKQPVPVGVEITNTDFWLEWADPNAQMEQLRQEVGQYADSVENLSDGLDLVNAALPISDFSAENTVKDYINNSIPPINPDSFNGDNDYEKLQNAINYAIENDFPTIMIARDYDITGYQLNVTKLTSYTNDNVRRRKNLTFIGINKAVIEKDDAGFIFTATAYSGDFCFINMHFRGNAQKTGASVFDVSKLIRIKTFGCFYENLKYVFDGTATLDSDVLDNMQSTNTYGDTAFQCKAYAFIRTSWDCCFDGATIEDCEKGITFDKSFPLCKIHDLLVSNCCIESTTCAIDFEEEQLNRNLQLVNVNINNCYFETNGQSDIKVNARFTYGLHITGNVFFQNIGDTTYYPIKIQASSSDITISANDASLGPDSNSRFVYFTDTTNTSVYGLRNSFRGSGAISNRPAKLHTSDKANCPQIGETLNFNYYTAAAYADSNGTIITLALPLPFVKDASLNPALTFNNFTLIHGGTVRTLIYETDVIVNSIAHNGGYLYVQLKLVDGEPEVPNREPLIVRFTNATVTFNES